MTRYKRRRIATALKWTILFMLPVMAAGAGRGIAAIKKTVGKIGSFSDEKVETRSVSADKNNLSVGDTDHILNGEVILSHGFGVYAEITSDEVRLQTPLEMESDDPGEKPYPTEWSPGVDIVRTTYGKFSGDSFFDLDNCGQVNNRTSISNEELLRESRIIPDFTFSDTDEPQVLIYHTHTTESFEPFVREKLDGEFNYRTTDDTKNMIMVGNAIQAELEAKGIGVIHVTEIHDYPSYNGSYGRSRESIVPILEQYPEIKVALDIHRDAIAGDGTAAQPYIEIDGREAAQIMIISGCDDGTLGMPDYMKNFHFACSLQQQLEGDNEGLTRPILFDYRHYNQDLTTGSLLIEVGSHGNTLDQVQYSGQLIGRSLSRLIQDMRSQ